MTPRPPQDELLDDQIQVRFTERELTQIRAHAKKMRTSAQEILRELGRQWLRLADERGPTFVFTIVEAEPIQAVAEEPAVLPVPESERLRRRRDAG